MITYVSREGHFPKHFLYKIDKWNYNLLYIFAVGA